MKRHAFTLMELLIVIGIIVLLMGILIPSVGHFRRAMRSSAITTYMGTIQTGLVAYSQDWRNDIPPSQKAAGLGIVDSAGNPADLTDWDGGELLAHALVGPLPDVGGTGTLFDRSNGPGFKTAAMSKKTYGPYLNIKDEYNLRPRFNASSYQPDYQVHGYKGLTPRDGAYVLTIAMGVEPMPFLYFTANPAGTALDTNIFAATGRFDSDHANDLWPMAAMTLKLTEKAIELRSARYLLMHGGPDEEYGNADDVLASGTTN